MAIEGGLTFGACASYAPFLNHDGYYCPDMVIPYWGDLSVQPGKKSGPACSYVFLRSWWQKDDLQALIDSETKQSSKSKDYEPTWDTATLKEVVDLADEKDRQATTPSEKDRGVSSEPIELITGFQKGKNAEFLTFHYQSKKIVRTKINKDPRGKMPIDWLYGDIDGTNPLGRGVVELVGGLQNLIDADMQMYQYNRALMLAPPVIKKGNFNKNKIVYAPNRVIDLGTDPNASVEALKIDTSAVINYPLLYGLQKSQLLNLVSSPDTSISADVGNPGFSKVPAGIKQQQANVSVDDNYVRKMFEAWFECWSETAINLYFAERNGIEELQLDEKTVNKLKKLADEGKFDLELINDQNQIRINYDEATPALHFKVDASTSKMKDDADSLAALSGLLETLEKNPLLQSVVPPEKIVATWNSIVAASGVEDPEDLSIDMDEFKKKQQEQAAAQQPAEPPKPLVPYKEAPEDVKRQMEQKDGLQPSQEVSPVQQTINQKTAEVGLETDQQAHDQTLSVESHVNQEMPMSNHDEQISTSLKQLGFDDQQISQALDMVNNGASEQEVLQTLGVDNARG